MNKLILAVLLGCVACGGGGGSVSIDDYPDHLRDAFCNYLVKCGESKDLDTCRTGHLGLDFSVGASERAAFDGKVATFDGVAAQACTDALGARDCDLTSQSNRVIPEACLGIAIGTVHDGAACAQDVECISQVCDVPACSMACCKGTCIGDAAPAFAKAGEACDSGLCDATSYCDEVATTCMPLKQSGDSCESSDECNYGFDCLPAGTCGTLPGPGESCTGACRDFGTTCSTASKTCVKVGLVGDACASSADCSQLYTCDATKHCGAGLALGAACSRSQLCAGAGAFCDVPDIQAMGTCVLPKADGTTCSANTDCQSEVCDHSTGTGGTGMCVADTVCLATSATPG
ncbi:MAG TPA: hypothetical protein VH165_32025 [Kofleriaceae bacterium]|jgi:hypothetical protein|nr:hypothetical protein [Kofleriaceae bacterium]